MMLPMLLMSSEPPMTYALSDGTRLNYTMQVVFEGLIPILGGQEGKVEANLGFLVDGLKEADGRSRASSELSAAEFIFNGAKLPLGLENVQDFFPKTTISFLPDGAIKSTDAPDITLPVKLPGLDVKRFPDISYLPVQFSPDPLAMGLKWSYQKPFGDSTVTYTCEVSEIKDTEVRLNVRVLQNYTVFEDSSMNVVPDPATDSESDAENRVTTDVKGEGTATFDRKRGVFKNYEVKAEAVSKVVPLQGGTATERKLTTLLRVVLKPN